MIKTLRAHTLYSAVDGSSNKLESGPTTLSVSDLTLFTIFMSLVTNVVNTDGIIAVCLNNVC